MFANPIQVKYVNGMGAVVPTEVSTIASTAASGAAATASILGGISAATTAAGTGGFLAGATIFGYAASAALPLIGLGIAAAISIGIAIANCFQGCGVTCTETTTIVNQAEPLFQQNVQAYLAIPVGTRTTSIQAAYLNNFQTLWNSLESACGNSAYGQAGVNCLLDRNQNECYYKTSPGGWQQINGVWQYVPPGLNGSGNVCWNWWVGYHDPISTDPTVISDAALTNELTGATGNVSSFPWIPLIALAIGGFVLMDNDI